MQQDAAAAAVVVKTKTFSPPPARAKPGGATGVSPGSAKALHSPAAGASPGAGDLSFMGAANVFSGEDFGLEDASTPPTGLQRAGFTDARRNSRPDLALNSAISGTTSSAAAGGGDIAVPQGYGDAATAPPRGRDGSRPFVTPDQQRRLEAKVARSLSPPAANGRYAAGAAGRPAGFKASGRGPRGSRPEMGSMRDPSPPLRNATGGLDRMSFDYELHAGLEDPAPRSRASASAALSYSEEAALATSTFAPHVDSKSMRIAMARSDAHVPAWERLHVLAGTRRERHERMVSAEDKLLEAKRNFKAREPGAGVLSPGQGVNNSPGDDGGRSSTGSGPRPDAGARLYEAGLERLLRIDERREKALRKEREDIRRSQVGARLAAQRAAKRDAQGAESDSEDYTRTSFSQAMRSAAPDAAEACGTEGGLSETDRYLAARGGAAAGVGTGDLDGGGGEAQHAEGQGAEEEDVCSRLYQAARELEKRRALRAALAEEEELATLRPGPEISTTAQRLKAKEHKERQAAAAAAAAAVRSPGGGDEVDGDGAVLADGVLVGASSAAPGVPAAPPLPWERLHALARGRRNSASQGATRGDVAGRSQSTPRERGSDLAHRIDRYLSAAGDGSGEGRVDRCLLLWEESQARAARRAEREAAGQRWVPQVHAALLAESRGARSSRRNSLAGAGVGEEGAAEGAAEGAEGSGGGAGEMESPAARASQEACERLYRAGRDQMARRTQAQELARIEEARLVKDLLKHNKTSPTAAAPSGLQGNGAGSPNGMSPGAGDDFETKEDVAERLYKDAVELQKKRREQIAEWRASVDAAELSECVFKPKINTNYTPPPRPAQPDKQTDDATIRGIGRRTRVASGLPKSEAPTARPQSAPQRKASLGAAGGRSGRGDNVEPDSATPPGRGAYSHHTPSSANNPASKAGSAGAAARRKSTDRTPPSAGKGPTVPRPSLAPEGDRGAQDEALEAAVAEAAVAAEAEALAGVRARGVCPPSLDSAVGSVVASGTSTPPPEQYHSAVHPASHNRMSRGPSQFWEPGGLVRAGSRSTVFPTVPGGALSRSGSTATATPAVMSRRTSLAPGEMVSADQEAKEGQGGQDMSDVAAIRSVTAAIGAIERAATSSSADFAKASSQARQQMAEEAANTVSAAVAEAES